MIFAPPRTRGAAVAAGLATLALLFGLALIWRGYTLRVSFAAILSYTIGAILLAGATPLAYWAYAAANLRYELKQGYLSIRWGFVEHVVPLHEIQRVVLGRHLPVPDVSGLRLPGLAVGSAHVAKLGDAAVYLRYRGPEDLLYLVTEHGAIGLSVPESQPFIRALQHAGSAESPANVRAGLRRGVLGSFGFWADRRVLALGGAGLLLSWLSAVVIYARFQGLSKALILHFPSTEIAHLGPRDRLLQIPESALGLFAAAAVIAILLFNRARVASYLVLGGAAVSGAVLLVAAIGATG